MDALSRVSPPFPCSHEPVNTSALPDRISSNKIANVLVFIPLSLSFLFFLPPVSNRSADILFVSGVRPVATKMIETK